MNWWASTSTSAGTAWGETIYVHVAPPPPPPAKPLLNPYVVLELPANGVPTKQVKQAYRRLAKQHHPDVGGDPEKMKMINEAYEFLKNKGLA